MIIQETPTLNLQFDKAKNDSDMLSLLKSQGGTFTRGSEVVGSGDSVASYVDALGTLRYAKLGHPRPNFVDGVNQGLLIEEARTNLIIQSNDFTNALYTKQNSTASKTGEVNTITCSSNGNFGIQTANVDTADIQTAISIDVKDDSNNSVFYLSTRITGQGLSSFLSAAFNLSTQTVVSHSGQSASIKDLGNGWFRLIYVYTPTTSTYRGFMLFTSGITSDTFSVKYSQYERGSFPTSYIPTKSTFVSRASTATFFDENGVLQTAPINIPRDNNHGFINGKWVKTGLFTEESRTNLLQRSEEFDNAYWTKTRSTVTANNTISPDGTLNAEKFIEDTSTSTSHFVVSPNISFVSGTTYTSTIFAKASERNHLLLRFGTEAFPTTDRDAWFNLSNGTVGTKGATVKASITKLPNSWYRLSITQTANATASTGVVYILGDGENLNYTGNGTSGVFIWGAQLEAGSASSYIPTAGTTITRSADITTSATVTRGAETSNRLTAMDIINKTEGTLYAKLFVSSGISKANRRILSINTDDTELQSVYLRLLGTNQPQLIVFNATNQVAISGSAVSGEVNVVGTYKENEFKLFVNGVKIGQDLSGTLPPFNRVDIASQAGNQLSDPLSKAILYPKALTEAESLLLSRL